MIPAIFSLLALLALFFKLPGVPELFGIMNCTTCLASSPYIPMFGGGYFSALSVASLNFSLKKVAPLGVILACVLAFLFTFFTNRVCYLCLFGHLCHLLFWLAWLRKDSKPWIYGKEISLVAVAFTSTLALFSTLNFSFLMYGFDSNPNTSSLLKKGAKSPHFSLKTVQNRAIDHQSIEKGLVLNFVSSNCHYCQEELQRLNQLALEYQKKGIRFINVTKPVEDKELQALMQKSPQTEFSMSYELFPLFGVKGFPTLYIIDDRGVIVKSQMGNNIDFDQELKRGLDTLFIK